MQLTFNKHTALAILRLLRAHDALARTRRSQIIPPDPHPRKSWTDSALKATIATLPYELRLQEFNIAVPSPDARIRSKNATCTTYAGGIPGNSFLDIGNGIAISGPELLFVELAESMHPIEHLVLGHELCGSFARNAEDPYNGNITYNVKPLTSVEKITRFLEEAKSIRGIGAARNTVKFLNDNAWSPTESVIAAFMRLPADCLGFDLGELSLNPRVDLAMPLPGAKTKRYPDIVIKGTPVGVNYDGLVHLDLASIVQASLEMGAHPEMMQTQLEVNRAIERVREKVLDDIRRNRELAASGLSVFPVLKEDLYTPNGLEMLVRQLVNSLEQFTDRDMSIQKFILDSGAFSTARRRMLLSLLPGKHNIDALTYQNADGHLVYETEPGVSECWIEL